MAEAVALDAIPPLQVGRPHLDEEAARAEPGQRPVERIGIEVGDPAQQIPAHRRPDHGRRLQDVLFQVRQPVHPRIQQRAQRGRHAQELDRPVQPIALADPLEFAEFDQRLQALLDE